MSNRLKNLSDESFVKVSLRAMQTLDNLMTAYGEDSHNPYGFGGALSYGWDMPTASVTFPRAYQSWRKKLEEAKKRGIVSVTHERFRKSKRGRIVYKVTGPIKYA
jgi:hypothetical protein